MSIVSDLTNSGLFDMGAGDKKEPLAVRRISDLIWLKVDEFGFAQMCRKTENKKSTHKILIPRPVKSLEDAKILLDAIEL